jgi:hypothetical protein
VEITTLLLRNLQKYRHFSLNPTAL